MRPRQGAAAAILDGCGRLLLVKENYDRRRYSLPGGAVEPDETPLEAAIREAREETGLVVRVKHVVGVYRLGIGFSATLFGCCASGDPVRPESGEIAEVGWFPADEIPKPTTNLLHYALPDIVAGRRGVFRDNLPRIN